MSNALQARTGKIVGVEDERRIIASISIMKNDAGFSLEDIDIDKKDFGFDCCQVAAVNGSSYGENEFADQQAPDPPDQQRKTTEAFIITLKGDHA